MICIIFALVLISIHTASLLVAKAESTPRNVNQDLYKEIWSNEYITRQQKYMLILKMYSAAYQHKLTQLEQERLNQIALENSIIRKYLGDRAPIHFRASNPII